MKRFARIVVLLGSMAAVPAFGQGCALCWTSANAASDGGKQALNRGIVVLLAAPLSLIAGIAVLTVRYSRTRDQEQEEERDS